MIAQAVQSSGQLTMVRSSGELNRASSRAFEYADKGNLRERERWRAKSSERERHPKLDLYTQFARAPLTLFTWFGLELALSRMRATPACP